MEGFAQFTPVTGQPANAGGDDNESPNEISVSRKGSPSDTKASSSFHYAAQLGDAETCRQLLARGADPRSRDSSGRTPAQLARAAGHFALSAALEGRVESAEEIARRQPLTIRELAGLINDEGLAIERLIEAGRVEARDAKGDSPLHILAMRGRLKAADLLVQAGADPRALNSKGLTPSEVARAGGHVVFAELLCTTDGSQVESANASASQGTAPHPPNAESSLTQSEIEVPDEAFDIGDLDLDFSGELAPEEFHDHSVDQHARATFQRVGQQVFIHDGAEDAGDWDLGYMGGEIVGEAVSTGGHGTSDQPLDLPQVGRRTPRVPAQRSRWRHFSIDEDVARDIAVRVVENGVVSPDDIDDLLFACTGRFDSDALTRNIILTFEDAGYSLEDEDALFDPLTEIDHDDLAEALIATCARAAALPGFAHLVPDAVEQKRLLGGMMQARRKVLLGLAEQPALLKIILYMTERVLEGSADAQEITLLDIPDNRRTQEAEHFASAALLLRGLTDDIAGGSSRAIHHAADALEALELRTDFLGQVAQALSEDTGFAQISESLLENLQAQEDGTSAAISGYLPLCRRLAAQRVVDGEDQEDLVQAGLFGLKRAIEKYDPNKSQHFTIYAGMWIRQTILRWRGDEGRIVRVPIHRLETISEMQRVVEDLEQATGSHPTVAAIASAWGRSIQLVWSLLDIPTVDVELTMLDEEIPQHRRTEAERKLEGEDVQRVIREALSSLPERVAWVIKGRNGIDVDDEMTLEELGQIEGVTRERIRQIELKGMNTLRHPARIRALREVL